MFYFYYIYLLESNEYLVSNTIYQLLRPEKGGKKGQKKKKIFFLKQISKCDTCFYMHFSRLFKKIVFISVALVIKALGYLRFFFTDWTFFRPVHESARTRKTTGGPNALPFQPV